MGRYNGKNELMEHMGKKFAGSVTEPRVRCWGEAGESKYYRKVGIIGLMAGCRTGQAGFCTGLEVSVIARDAVGHEKWPKWQRGRAKLVQFLAVKWQENC